ncbi:hypothetical protein TRAPUB_3172 [Trametes pubescens]|uniref:Uncharacterized protein n=1 Tax=Trametes pubescens TaxID=154538 RepID=A0A1M2VEG3_TRAPU|nr:hypothetical protein TRAPUB_3172 [Trametes pubescens]
MRSHEEPLRRAGIEAYEFFDVHLRAAKGATDRRAKIHSGHMAPSSGVFSKEAPPHRARSIEADRTSAYLGRPGVERGGRTNTEFPYVICCGCTRIVVPHAEMHPPPMVPGALESPMCPT